MGIPNSPHGLGKDACRGSEDMLREQTRLRHGRRMRDSAPVSFSTCILSALLVVLVVLAATASEAADADVWKEIAIGNAWGGTDVKFDAVANEEFAYVAFYDENRVLTLARVALKTGEVDQASLKRVFGGFDSHNEIRLHEDHFGRLHLAADMHASPLVYGTMSFGATPNDFTLTNSMTGFAEAEVSYPRFHDLADGTLVFVYRDGRSGDASTRIKFNEEGRWRDLSAPLFAGRSGKRHFSAYFSDIEKGPDGKFHLSWLWRLSSDVSTNCDINYASSPDFKRWKTLSNERLDTPISIDSRATAIRISVGHGLQNPPALSFDRAGKPMLVYVANDTEGIAQVFVATPDGESAWTTKSVTHWIDRVDVKGAGTRPKFIRYSKIQLRPDGGYILPIYHEGIGSCQLTLSEQLDPMGCANAGVGQRRPPTPSSLTSLPAGYQLLRLPAQVSPEGKLLNIWLVWAAQQAPGDKRPLCTAVKPVACTPPSLPLTLFVEGLPGK